MASQPIAHEMMRCTLCQQEKLFSVKFFPTDGDRLRRQCRLCRAENKRRNRHENETPERRGVRLAKAREYQKVNRASIAQKQCEWRAENADKVRDYHRARYEANREEIKARARQWRVDNLDRKREINRAWNDANREKANSAFRRSKQKRRLSPGVRAFESVSEQIRAALRGQKDGRSWESLVGFTRVGLVAHLERQFHGGMSWENYGEWHIDHIIPVASFAFASPEDEEFTACWSITNLRPLWAADNIRKADKRTLLL